MTTKWSEIKRRKSLPVKRIQRQRTKGWRMPPGAVYVGRDTRWGNPFLIGPGGLPSIRPPRYSRAEAVRLFRIYAGQEEHRGYEWLEPLRGRDLVCWCSLEQECHADVLLELANA